MSRVHLRTQRQRRCRGFLTPGRFIQAIDRYRPSQRTPRAPHRSLRRDWQGQRTLSYFSRKDLRQEVDTPAG